MVLSTFCLPLVCSSPRACPGVSKCGTTDLFGRLKKHPELADGSKVRMKAGGRHPGACCGTCSDGMCIHMLPHIRADVLKVMAGRQLGGHWAGGIPGTGMVYFIPMRGRRIEETAAEPLRAVTMVFRAPDGSQALSRESRPPLSLASGPTLLGRVPIPASWGLHRPTQR